MLAMQSLSEIVCKEWLGGQSEAMKPFASALVVTAGANVSCTLTWNPQEAALPELSTAVQVLSVGEGYSGNLVPDGGEQVTCATPQLSVAVGANVAAAPSSVHSSVWSAGQMITGGVVSTTVTVAEHDEDCWDALSTQVSVTIVEPSGKGPSELWVQVTSLSPSLSVEPALIEALPWQVSSSDTVLSWQLAEGGQNRFRVDV